MVTIIGGEDLVHLARKFSQCPKDPIVIKKVGHIRLAIEQGVLVLAEDYNQAEINDLNNVIALAEGDALSGFGAYLGSLASAREGDETTFEDLLDS